MLLEKKHVLNSHSCKFTRVQARDLVISRVQPNHTRFIIPCSFDLLSSLHSVDVIHATTILQSHDNRLLVEVLLRSQSSLQAVAMSYLPANNISGGGYDVAAPNPFEILNLHPDGFANEISAIHQYHAIVQYVSTRYRTSKSGWLLGAYFNQAYQRRKPPERGFRWLLHAVSGQHAD